MSVRRAPPTTRHRRRRSTPHDHPRHTPRRRRPRPRRVLHRGPQLGLRQLRHPLQGVRHARHPARPLREDRRRRADPCLHRVRAARLAALPLGQGRGLRRAAGVRRRTGHDAGHDQLQHLPGRRVQVRLPHPRRQVRAASGDRPPSRVHRRHARHRLEGDEDLAGRRHELRRSGLDPGPSGPPGGVPPGDLPGPRGRRAPGAGVQVLRAGVLSHRCSGLGHEPAALPGPRREGPGGARHRPSRPRHQHRVHRRPAAAPEPAGRLRLQLPQLRGRRSHRRAPRTRSSCSGFSSRSCSRMRTARPRV